MNNKLIAEFLNEVATLSTNTDETLCWNSKFDNSFICNLGQEASIIKLAEMKITTELQHGLGYSFYYDAFCGWKPNAIDLQIYMYPIGKVVNIGDPAYIPHCLENEIKHINELYPNTFDLILYNELTGYIEARNSDVVIYFEKMKHYPNIGTYTIETVEQSRMAASLVRCS